MSEPEQEECKSVVGRASARDYIQSIERGFAVLLAFDEHLPQPSLSELSAKTGLSRPAVRRILLTLERLGYVEQRPGRWALTPRVLSIGQHYTATHALTELAKPHLLTIMEQTQESASLAVLDGADVVYVARVQVRRIMSIHVDVGARVAAHATGMGHTLMSEHSPRELRHRLGEGPFQRFTPHTIVDMETLQQRLSQVRTQGYALADSELEVGLLSVSVPVRDRTGKVVATLASSSSVGRTDIETMRHQVLPLLQEQATLLNRTLRHTT